MSLDSGFNLGNAVGHVDIRADGVKAGMDTARRAFLDGVRSMTDSWKQVGDEITGIGARFTAITLPMTLFGRQGIKAASDFDSSMSMISARTGLVGEELEKVRELALKMGADTVFNAQQSSDAFLQLLTAGMSAEQAIAALPSVLTAAAASGEDLGRSADLVTNVLAAFGIEAERAGEVVQIMSAAAASSPATMGEIGEALQSAGGFATGFGLDLEQTTAILARFAGVGIRGSEAATQLRSVLREMSSTAGQKAFQKLGVTLYDTAGNVRDLDTVFEELGASLNQLPVEEQNKLIQDLAGSYGQVGFRTLLAADGFDDMIETMRGQTDVTEVAASMMDTFKGAIESLMGSIETLQITVFTPFMDETLKPFIQQLIEIVDRITAWAAENPELVKQIVMVGAALSALGPALVALGITISTVAFGLGGLVPVLGLLLSPIGLVAGAVAALGIAWANNFMGMRDVLQPFVDTVTDAIGAAWYVLSIFVRDVQDFGLREAFLGIFGQGSLGETVQSTLEGALVTNLGIERDKAIAIVESLWRSLSGIARNIETVFNRIFNALKPLFVELATFFSGLFDRIDFSQVLQIGSTLLSLTNPIGQAMTVLRVFGVDFLSIFESIIGGFTTFVQTINQGGGVFDGLRAVFGDTEFIATIEQIFNDLVLFITDTVIPGLDSLRAWFVDDALPAIVNFLQTVVLPAVQDFFAFLGNVWNAVSPGLIALGDWFINGLLPLMVSTIETVAIPIIETFIGILSDIWIRVSPHLLSLWNWFTQEGLPAITAFLQETVIPVIGDLVGILSDLWEDVSPFLFDLLDWFITSGLPVIKDFIETVVIPVVETLVGWLIDLWEAVQPGLTQLYDWFVTTALPGIIAFLNETVTPLISDFISLLSTIWETISPGLNDFKDGMVEIFGWIIENAVQPLITLIESIAGLITDAIEDIRTNIQKVEDFIQDPVGALFGGSGTEIQTEGMTDAQIQHQIRMVQDPQYAISPQAQMMQMQIEALEGRALGGPVDAWQAYMVGERGPELFVPQQNGTIVPNGAFGKTFSPQISVTVEGGADPQGTGEILAEVVYQTVLDLYNEIEEEDRGIYG